MEWLEKKHEAASQRAPTVAVVVVEPSIPMHEKGKRKILDHME